MGEEELIILGCANDDCLFMSCRRDCDGDWDSYCYKLGACPYQKKAKDCDGDIIMLCRK